MPHHTLKSPLIILHIHPFQTPAPITHSKHLLQSPTATTRSNHPFQSSVLIPCSNNRYRHLSSISDHYSFSKARLITNFDPDITAPMQLARCCLNVIETGNHSLVLVQCLLNVCSMFAQCLFNVCLRSVQCLFNVCSIFGSMFVQVLFDVYCLLSKHLNEVVLRKCGLNVDFNT